MCGTEGLDRDLPDVCKHQQYSLVTGMTRTRYLVTVQQQYSEFCISRASGVAKSQRGCLDGGRQLRGLPHFYQVTSEVSVALTTDSCGTAQP